jgi:soluble lytic murein transglycosylase
LPPSEALSAARHYQENGRYEEAIYAYLSILDAAPDLEEARAASYGLAESYLAARAYPAAAAAWERFLEAYPDDARRPTAHFSAARAYEAAALCEPAIEHYRAYLDIEATLADVAYEAIGDCWSSMATDPAGSDTAWDRALAAYGEAVAATGDGGVEVNLREKMAGIHLAREAYEQAVAEYDAILKVARIEAYRARIEYLAGQALALAGDVDAAHARYRRAVNRYPEAEFAYLALVELVDAGVPVDEFQRGLIDYHAGSGYPDAYGAAIRAFDRYLAGEERARADEALYYKAQSQRAYDQPEAALDTLDALIEGYPDSEWAAEGWLLRGHIYAALGEDDAAVKAYRDTAAFLPDSDVAPQAMWAGARTRERAGDFEEAAVLYDELQAAFPAHEDAPDALWRGGLGLYRLGDEAGAGTRWQALLEKYPRSGYRPRVLYWLGKLGRDQGSDYWGQLVDEDPLDYYAVRVVQIESGEPLTVSRLITASIEAPARDLPASDAEILSWLRDWTQVPTGTTSLSLPGALASRVDVRRGEALLAVGLRRDALDAFDAVRAAAWDSPLDLARLALYFREQGLYGLAARAALRLAGLWPGGTLYDAPLPVQHLAYPLAYADLLSAEAASYDLDPLLLAALVRQESLFEKAAESYAGARGLGQVMPATGEGIARSLDMDDFVLDDLYRPWVSIRFGAFYLSVQLDRFDDHLLVALAAYNGGPGNALRWIEMAGGDPLDVDLFVEVITAGQSRNYLQTVYVQYLKYEELYRAVER